MTHIVYEDDEIRAIWHSGDTDFLLVTFGDLVSRVDDVHFFADAPVIKSRLSCLGVMAKRPNWFPADSMRKLRARVDGYIAPYQTRITYGGSMGGYGAVKYSALMGATHIVALCPQWSISPADCDRRYTPWSEFYVPAMRDMAIRAEDISGRLVVFCDSRFDIDNYHRTRIQSLYPGLIAVDVKSADHHVTSVFAGTQNLNDLIFAVRYLPPNYILSIANALRRRSIFRDEVVLRRATMRYPRIVARILMSRARNDPDYRGLRLNFYTDVLRALLRGHQRPLAARFALAFSGQLSRRSSRRLLGYVMERTTGRLRESADGFGSSSASAPG